MSADIDFDELDKAVNSLMGNVAPDKNEAEKPKTLSINTTLQPDEKPEYQKIDEVAKTIGNETLTTDAEKRVVIEDLDALSATAPKEATDSAKELLGASRPAGGRFMDVVHPSSDMRSTTSLPPLRVPARKSEAPSEATPESVPEPTEPVESVEPVAEPESPVVEPVAPLAAVEQEQESEPEEEKVEEQQAPEPPMTPFLPDAKVEKRPLGEPMVISGAIPSPFADDDKKESADEQQTNEPVAEVEKKEDTDETEEIEETISVNSEKQEPNPAADDQSVLDPSTLASEAEAAAVAAVESTEVASDDVSDAEIAIRSVESGDTEKLTAIKQAVKADLTPGVDAGAQTGSIYDVDNQPQPLSHPTKQKSGITTVVIILIIIVLAAALGAAAYFILGLGV